MLLSDEQTSFSNCESAYQQRVTMLVKEWLALWAREVWESMQNMK
jgi:hypothetical protein